MIVDRTTAADVFGVSPETIRVWQKAGAPFLPPQNPRGTPDERKVTYQTERLHNWLVQRALRSW